MQIWRERSSFENGNLVRIWRYVCVPRDGERKRERESEASSVNMIKYDYGEEEQI